MKTNGVNNMRKQAVDNVIRVPIEKVFANDYNPNTVAKQEMKLLYISIKHDGYTMPVVTVYDKENDRYVIVDGFHRYSVMKLYKDIYEENDGLLPIVVISENINDRMASTVRHNRARGKHSIDGMSNIVMNMLQNGWDDQRIMFELGLEKEELIRLKHLTGYAKFFENSEYNHAIMTDKQIEEKLKYQEGENEDE